MQTPVVMFVFNRPDLTRRSLATMVECAPLTAVEADRPRIHMPDVVPLVELKQRGSER